MSWTKIKRLKKGMDMHVLYIERNQFNSFFLDMSITCRLWMLLWVYATAGLHAATAIVRRTFYFL
jgi:hypothetical protein